MGAGDSACQFLYILMSRDTALLLTQRAQLLARLAQDCTYDIAVVGGGATGLGVALDAAARGLSVVLVEHLLRKINPIDVLVAQGLQRLPYQARPAANVNDRGSFVF